LWAAPGVARPMVAEKEEGIKIVATNRKAHQRFRFEDRYEAGMVLWGTEVKSLRQGTCSIEESFARPRGSDIYLYDMHIPPYEQGNRENHEPKRARKLLLHRREIGRIISQCTQRGYTLVPLKVYFKRGIAKVEIALARRKQMGDRRQKELKERGGEDIRQALGRRRLKR